MAEYPSTATTPEQRVELACAWAAQDYGKPSSRWMRLVRLCERKTRQGEPCIRRGDLYRMAQEEGLEISLCREFRFDNNIWSALSRYLLMFRPRLAASIHPKRSEIDDVDLVRVWHEQVNPQTFFFAETWQEAVEAYELQDVSAR